MISKVAASDATVLLTGETGTGKELAARALHRLSRHHDGPFLVINCGAVPETMLERELFGHERGAFTGADSTRPGLVEAASDGTLFLDEIGEMPHGLQVKLLRVLEGHEFTRLGGTKPIKSMARFVAATNQDLKKNVAERRFREDLFYRLNGVTVALPPLRERGADVVLLAGHFLKQFARERGKAGMEFAPEVEATLQTYPWPGNVRELRNVVERALLLSTGERIGINDLCLSNSPSGEAGGPLAPWSTLPYRDAKEMFEKAYLAEVLRSCEGNITQAAERIGLDRRNLFSRIKKYGLKSEA